MTTKRNHIENPYFVRVELYSPIDGWTPDETITRVKAFATKREAWEYVKKVIEDYHIEHVVPGSMFYTSIKVQRNWKTLWQA